MSHIQQQRRKWCTRCGQLDIPVGDDGMCRCPKCGKVWKPKKNRWGVVP